VRRGIVLIGAAAALLLTTTARASDIRVPDVWVDESAGHATVALGDDPSCPQVFVVDYHTKDGTAKAGRDYRAVSGRMLVLTNLLGPAQTFDVPIINDRVREPDETLSVVLHVTTLEGETGVCPPPWYFNKTVVGRITIEDDDRRSR
jgi:hypothetical protein